MMNTLFQLTVLLHRLKLLVWITSVREPSQLGTPRARPDQVRLAHPRGACSRVHNSGCFESISVSLFWYPSLQSKNKPLKAFNWQPKVQPNEKNCSAIWLLLCTKVGVACAIVSPKFRH